MLRVVEDDADIAAVYQVVLEVSDVRESTAGLFHVEEWEGFTVALVDHMLPGDHTGLELCHWLKDNTTVLPILATAAGDYSLRDMDTTGVIVLRKPVPLDVLKEVVEGGDQR